MSLRHILLGFLQTPQSGYDLRRQFEESVAAFWSAKLSQIYPTLRKMEQDGLVISEKQASPKGPDRVVYARTPEGERELETWLLSGPLLQEQRNHFLAQVYFLDHLPPDEAASFFDRMAEMCDWQGQRLDERDALYREQCGDTEKLADDQVYKYAALDLGRRGTRMYAEWARDWAKTIRGRKASD